jgi:hypothetical protein
VRVLDVAQVLEQGFSSEPSAGPGR